MNDTFSPNAHDDASNYSRDRYGSHATSEARRAHDDSPDADGRMGRHSAQQEPRHSAQRASQPTSQSEPRHGAHARSYEELSSQEIYREISRVRKRGKRGKRIAAVIGCIVLVAALALGGYAWWFVHQLDAALAPDEETVSELQKVLVPETPGKPFYVLVAGSDSREGNAADHRDEAGSNERSDVMMLVRVDRDKNVITMLSIPRDTPYKLEDGSYVKINEMFNHDGVAGMITAVSNLTGLPISHYAGVRISGLEAIVDLLGGVTVDVPVDLTYETTDHKTVTVPAGKQKLNGQEAQIFARARHEFEEDQDTHRQSNVRQLLSAVIDEVRAKPVTKLPDIVLEAANYIDTDYKTFDAVSLVTSLSDGKMTTYSATGPSNGSNNSATVGKWLCYLNPEGWKKAVELTDQGKDPEGVDYSETEIPWEEVTDQPDFDGSMAQLYYYG